MKKLSDERLYELKAAANKQGKESYEVMTNEELAAYRINCLDALDHRKRMMAKYEGTKVMYKIVSDGADWLEGALAYIDEKLGA